jgi:hypothetical protein
MSLVFSAIDSDQTDGLWSKVRDGFAEVKRRWPNAVTWQPDNVQESLKGGSAQLVFIYDDMNRVGYFVVRKFREEFKMTPYLHIWMAYLYPEYRGKVRDYLPETMAYIERIAKQHSCQYIEMDSPRIGWKNLLRKFKMNQHREVYRKELGHG